jgi:hypothetical protein
MTTMMTRTRHLRPGPQAGYLAGLGLIRVLGEQADKNATAAWTRDGLRRLASSIPAARMAPGRPGSVRRTRSRTRGAMS